MKIAYPSETEIQKQREEILDSLPRQQAFHERLKAIYWEPGLKIIFHQCSSAWLITGMVYLMTIAACILSENNVKFQIFFSLLCCPLLYLVFSFVALLSEEQVSVIELKHTLHHSFTRLISLRMFYSSIIAMLLDIALLWNLHNPDIWAIGAVGISSMFLFALLSLYLYHRLGNCWCIGGLLMVWTGLCVGILQANDRIYHFFFAEVPIAVHLATAFCCMVAFSKYALKSQPTAKTQYT